MEELALENLQIEHPGKGVVRVVIDRQEQLNALNGWDFRSSLVLAKGSEIYVPGS